MLKKQTFSSNVLLGPASAQLISQQHLEKQVVILDDFINVYFSALHIFHAEIARIPPKSL